MELSEALAKRHQVRVLALADRGGPPPPAGGEWSIVTAPAPAGGPWQTRGRRRAALEQALDALLAVAPPHVMVGHHDTGPAVVAAATRAGRPAVLALPSYEALCAYAFYPGSDCVPESRCRHCPRALAMEPAERAALHAARDAQEEALAGAAALLAPARSLAVACEEWKGRRPAVVAPVVGAPPLTAGRPEGHVLAAAALWTANKGVELLAPLAARLAPRPLLVQFHHGGLAPRWRDELAALPNVALRESPPAERPRLEGAAVAIVPSLMDVFPRVAFEAMAAGIPVLASDVGGLTELVPDQQRVARFADPGAWAAAVRGLQDADAWWAAARRGREAAAAVMATRPVERVEALLAEAAPDGHPPMTRR